MQRSALHCLVANMTNILWSTLHWASNKRSSLHQPPLMNTVTVARCKECISLPRIFPFIILKCTPPLFRFGNFQLAKNRKKRLPRIARKRSFFWQISRFSKFSQISPDLPNLRVWADSSISRGRGWEPWFGRRRPWPAAGTPDLAAGTPNPGGRALARGGPDGPYRPLFNITFCSYPAAS